MSLYTGIVQQNTYIYQDNACTYNHNNSKMNALIISLKVLICEVSTSCESLHPSFIVEAMGRLSLIAGKIKSKLEQYSVTCRQVVSEQTQGTATSWDVNYRFKTHSDLSADKDLRHVGYKLNERRDSNGYRSIGLKSQHS